MSKIELICDRRSLIFHRFVARRLKKDPMLAERARAALGYVCGVGGAGEDLWSVVYDEWDSLLRGGIAHVREMLPLRTPEMDRLRVWSPFMIVDDPITRELVEGPRLWKLARRGCGARRSEETTSPREEQHVQKAQEIHYHYHFHADPPPGLLPPHAAPSPLTNR